MSLSSITGTNVELNTQVKLVILFDDDNKYEL